MGQTTYVVITGIRIPFWSLVGFLIKFAIASVPAAIVIGVLWASLGGFVWGLIMSNIH